MTTAGADPDDLVNGWIRIKENTMITDEIRKLAEKYYPQVVELRNYFHRHPELSGLEFQTAEKIA